MTYRLPVFMILLVTAALQGKAQEARFNGDWFIQNLGPTINTEYRDRFSMISPDGLALYFSSDRPSNLGNPNERGRKPWDIYVAWRNSADEPFGEAVNLGPTVNSPYRDHSASFSPDGLSMYFASDRPGGCGGYDLYVSYRQDANDHSGWQAPEHLGCTVNTRFDESCPILTTDERTDFALLYLVRNALPGEPNHDIYVTQLHLGTREFEEALPVTELNTSVHDGHFDPRHGLIWSLRDGGYGGADLWVTGWLEQGGWSPPENLGPSINSEHNEELPSATSDGRLYFPSDRPGGFGDEDIYVATPADP